jgi:Carboxylesterase family
MAWKRRLFSSTLDLTASNKVLSENFHWSGDLKEEDRSIAFRRREGVQVCRHHVPRHTFLTFPIFGNNYLASPFSSSFPSTCPQPVLITMRVTIPGKGTLQGAMLLDPATKTSKCHRFSSVPYAVPPTGALRWRKPEPLAPAFSYSSKEYTKPSSVCPQPRVFGTQATTHDENCLQANIYVPVGKTPHSGWPVFFYIRRCTLFFVYLV